MVVLLSSRLLTSEGHKATNIVAAACKKINLLYYQVYKDYVYYTSTYLVRNTNNIDKNHNSYPNSS